MSVDFKELEDAFAAREAPKVPVKSPSFPPLFFKNPYCQIISAIRMLTIVPLPVAPLTRIEHCHWLTIPVYGPYRWVWLRPVAPSGQCC